jgi:hypothetical protein
MWPNMLMLNVMQSYYEFSGDKRVLDFMARYFKWQMSVPEADFMAGYWPKMRVGDNIESIHWLYNRTGERWLLELGEKCHKHGANWTSGVINWHGVNISQGFREPANFYVQSKTPMHLAAAVGTQVVVPFGSTSPELTGPGLPGLSRHQLILGQAPCAPCFLRECPVDFRCMKSIAVEQIVNAMKSATQKSP